MKIKIIAACCLLFAVFFVYNSFLITPKDMKEWYVLLESIPKNKRKELLKTSIKTQQEREHISKFAFLNTNNEYDRKKMYLSAKHSQVVARFVRNKIHLTEHLKGVSGIVQQEIFYKMQDNREIVRITKDSYKILGKSDLVKTVDEKELVPMQRFRYFEADSAVFDIASGILTAHNVYFWGYETRGHYLCFNRELLLPLFQGYAKELKMCPADSQTKNLFSADNVKIQILNGHKLW